jgi:hypothetical protein
MLILLVWEFLGGYLGLENFLKYFFENQVYLGVIECGEFKKVVSIIGMGVTWGVSRA